MAILSLSALGDIFSVSISINQDEYFLLCLIDVDLSLTNNEMDTFCFVLCRNGCQKKLRFVVGKPENNVYVTWN